MYRFVSIAGRNTSGASTLLRTSARHPARIAVWTMVSMATATAADYPTKPVRLIVPFAAGSATEIPGRLLAQKAAQRLGQMVVVDNRSGAEGRIGVELVAKAPADGYTIGMGTIGTLVIAPLIYTKLAYDPATALALISPMVTAPFLVVIHPAVPAATLRELVDFAKARPGQLNLAGSNVFAKLVGEMFNSAAGVKTVYVPYPGSGQDRGTGCIPAGYTVRQIKGLGRRPTQALCAIAQRPHHR
jgi:tripartite-type tricarboxylate transporter receptor subunit TctC